MQRLRVLWIIACIGLLFVPAGVFGAGPPTGLNVNVVNTGVYQFVGFSTETTNGDAGGIGGMHALCQQDYGPDARMVTTKELLLSPGVPAVDGAGDAWVQPTIVTTVGTTHYDYSGTPFNVQNGTCYQWSSDGGPLGMVFSQGSGGVSASIPAISQCSRTLPVACGKPITK